MTKSTYLFFRSLSSLFSKHHQQQTFCIPTPDFACSLQLSQTDVPGSPVPELCAESHLGSQFICEVEL